MNKKSVVSKGEWKSITTLSGKKVVVRENKYRSINGKVYTEVEKMSSNRYQVA